MSKVIPIQSSPEFQHRADVQVIERQQTVIAQYSEEVRRLRSELWHMFWWGFVLGGGIVGIVWRVWT